MKASSALACCFGGLAITAVVISLNFSDESIAREKVERVDHINEQKLATLRKIRSAKISLQYAEDRVHQAEESYSNADVAARGLLLLDVQEARAELAETRRELAALEAEHEQHDADLRGLR